MNSEVVDFWEDLYSGREPRWSGRPNVFLTAMVEHRPAGTALDLGCGEGGDAVWLARQGWEVTAVDVSASALARASDLAAAEGVQARIEFGQHDLEETFPAGSFDLVSAQFLQSPVHLPREQILQAAARAVAPDGLLLIVEHGSAPSWSGHHDVVHPTPEQTYATLELDSAQWETERLDAPERDVTGPDGQSGVVTDNVIAVRRRR